MTWLDEFDGRLAELDAAHLTRKRRVVVRMTPPLHYQIRPGALKVLMPPPPPLPLTNGDAR